ncbi:amino acid ABC transporter permease [Pseudomonas koreensis]|uniref:amino acid ABC transporter permease n=1 Tax=Pseudomonas koreensis TaxID=198620 RepID=UPI00320A7D57
MLSELLIFQVDLIEQLPLIFSGLLKTLQLTVVVTLLGLLGGVCILYMRISQNKLTRRAVEAYISFFIGVPLIVILFVVYYGLPQYGIRLSPFVVAVICFALNVSAYNASYMFIAYQALDRKELEAAKAQGFNSFQVYRFVTLPQVLRTSTPALSNQVISNLKDSSYAFMIGYTDVFARIQELASMNFQFFNAYLFAAIVYLVLVAVIVLFARVVEKRFLLNEV